MTYFKSLFFTVSKFTFVPAIAAAMLLASCVKPANHESKVDGGASFIVDKMSEPKMSTTMIPGFSLPASHTYTFEACVRDRRTEEALPSAPFKIQGGASDQDVRSNNQGCLIWSETIPFNFLSNEMYLPLNRTIVALGTQMGARQVKMAINPWKLNDRSEKFKDLAHTEVAAEQLATAGQLDLALKPSAAGSVTRFLNIQSLPISNSPGATVGGSPVRTFKVQILPTVTLTDITGTSTSVEIKASAGKLKVSAALVESLTSGGRETKSTVSKTAEPVAITVQNGLMYAEFSLAIARGSEASRFLLALKVEPVDGPKGLQAFEGLFAIGDLHSVTESGSSTGELKASNADPESTTAFNFTTVVGNGQQLFSAGGGVQSGASRRTGLFKVSTLVPSWSGPVKEDVANHRTVMYSVRACFIDLSNGSRPAVNETFTLNKADGTQITAVASDKAEKLGCIDWEDTIKHRYYASEKWTRVPVTMKHASGYEEKQEYVIAPWGAWSFTVDPGAKADFINQINSRPLAPSRLLADGVEFSSGMNTRDVYSYEVDDFLSMQIVKRIAVRIPLRVFRPSNIRDGANMVPEMARTGKYLLKAAFAAPVRGVGENKEEMLISPMRGLYRVVDVRGGEIKTELDFAINDVRLMNARSYLVFEVKIIDEDKLPADDLYLRKAGANPEAVIDYEAGAVMPTYVAPLFLKAEKDFGITIPVGDLSLDLPTTDAINQIPRRDAVAGAVSTAIRPFANITVEKLYTQARQSMQDYRTRMNRERSLGLFARRANAEFVSIHNEPKVVSEQPLLKENNQILANGGRGVESLLTLLNRPLSSLGSQEYGLVYNVLGQPRTPGTSQQPSITKATLQDLVKGDKPFDKKLAAQLCGYFFSTTPRSKLSSAQMIGVELGRADWTDDCIKKIAQKSPDEVFLRDRRVRAIQVNPVATKIRGRSMTFHTGVDINIGKVASRSWGYGVGIGSGGLTGELSKLGMMGQSSSRMMKVLTAAPAVSGLSAEISTSWDHTTAVEQGAGFGSGTNLTMEQTELRIQMNRSEACVVLRPRPDFVEAGLRMRMMKLAIGEQSAEELMSRGLMICNGFPARAEVTERYYTFGYEQPAANALDPHAIENLPWILSLRGQRDYATFLLIASASQATVADARRTEIDIGDMPLARLEESYKQYFLGKTASIPGFLTSEPKIMRVRNANARAASR